MAVHLLDQFCQVLLGQPQGFPQVPYSAAHAICGDHAREHGKLRPLAVVHAEDQLLTNLAGEVEVDIGEGYLLTIAGVRHEPLEAESELEWVDVRQAYQVADDERHGRAAPAPRWLVVEAGVRVDDAQLDLDLVGYLDDVAVLQKKP